MSVRSRAVRTPIDALATFPHIAHVAGEAFELWIGGAGCRLQPAGTEGADAALKAFIAFGSLAGPSCVVEPPSPSLLGRILL